MLCSCQTHPAIPYRYDLNSLILSWTYITHVHTHTHTHAHRYRVTNKATTVTYGIIHRENNKENATANCVPTLGKKETKR